MPNQSLTAGFSPASPDDMDWSSRYPQFVRGSDEDTKVLNDIQKSQTIKQLKKDVEVADVGCGFGGLLFALAPIMPETLILGMSAYFSSSKWLIFFSRGRRVLNARDVQG